MIFVEGLRLLVVLAGVLVGLGIGTAGHWSRLVGAVLGALVGYLIGGIVGRLLDREFVEVTRKVRDVPAAEILGATLLGGLGVIIGVIICIPLFIFVPSHIDVPITAVVAWILGALGLRIGMTKGAQLAEAAGLTSRLSADRVVLSDGALLVDTSAILDRSLFVLGMAGLLPRELVVPEVVIDEVRTLADGPDPVSSRRARRGLESLEALKSTGITITVAGGEVPAGGAISEKVTILARDLGVRVATCSTEVIMARNAAGLPVLDLRRLAGELSPDHLPGERLQVDLIKAGRQERQAVGYLPDGDMVVVNDADDLIGSNGVAVVVLSTRQTSQGLLLFARLSSESPARVADHAGAGAPERPAGPERVPAGGV